MEKQEFEAVFCKIFEKNGLNRFCKPDIIEKFRSFTDIFLEANAAFNLTAIKEIPDVIAKHYADCLLAEELFPIGASVMDIGCGGGFPTFPLAIARPDLSITAVDSTQKKISFVAETAKQLGLSSITALCARAEAEELRPYREGFDVVTSRAMARMTVLSELAVPFVKVGGKLVALKGALGAEEQKEAERALKILGIGSSNAIRATLKTEVGEEVRYFLIATKQKPTPAQYPRQYAAIIKKPL